MKLSTKILGAALAGAFFYAAPASAWFATEADWRANEPQEAAVAASSPFVLGPTTPGKWGSPVFGTGATVTWSLMGSGLDTDAGPGTSVALASFMPVGFKAEIQKALDAWAAVADLVFVEMPDPGVGWQAPGAEAVDLRFTGHAFDGAGGVLAHGFYPPNNGGAAAGDMHFDTAELWKIGFGGPGFDIFQVAAHELGHALGLDHTAVPLSLMNPFYTEAISGPQADDIAGMQFIYGAPQGEAPAPGTMLLLAVGMLALGLRGRRATTAA